MTQSEKKIGLGGWMILPMIGLWVASVLYAALFFTTLVDIFVSGPSVFDVSIIILAFLMTGGVVYILTLAYKKKKDFKNLFIIFLWVGVLISIILSIETNEYTRIAREIISAIIWSLYITSSKRVENTFVK